MVEKMRSELLLLLLFLLFFFLLSVYMTTSKHPHVHIHKHFFVYCVGLLASDLHAHRENYYKHVAPPHSDLHWQLPLFNQEQ